MKTFLTLIVVMVALFEGTPTAAAQHDDPEIARAIHTLGRQCANESGFNSRVDCEAIWQTTTVIANGRTAPAILDAQYRLSPATTDSERWIDSSSTKAHRARRRARLEVGNLRWSRHLTWNDVEPRGWRRANGDTWDRYDGRWARIRRWATVRVVSFFETGARGPRVCRGTPITWGRRDGGDNYIMARRNRRRIAVGLDPWVLLECRNPRGRQALNQFWGRAPRIVSTVAVRK